MRRALHENTDKGPRAQTRGAMVGPLDLRALLFWPLRDHMLSCSTPLVSLAHASDDVSGCLVLSLKPHGRASPSAKLSLIPCQPSLCGLFCLLWGHTCAGICTPTHTHTHAHTHLIQTYTLPLPCHVFSPSSKFISSLTLSP